MNTILLAATLHRRGLFELDRRLLMKLPRVLASCVLMSAFLLFAVGNAGWVTAILFGQPLLSLLVVCGAGAGVFGISAMATGALQVSEVRQALRRP